MNAEWFDALALLLGWTVLIAGGVALTLALVGVAMDYGWRKMKDAHGFAVLQAAVRAYTKGKSL